jgi:hypothetical protein
LNYLFYEDNDGGDQVELKKADIEEIQEKLILIYRFISQHKMFRKFYCQGMEVEDKVKDDFGLISRLIEMDDAEELLKNCILELEDMKGGGEAKKVDFQEMIINQDWNYLNRKYGLKTMDDVGKLDLNEF